MKYGDWLLFWYEFNYGRTKLNKLREYAEFKRYKGI